MNIYILFRISEIRRRGIRAFPSAHVSFSSQVRSANARSSKMIILDAIIRIMRGCIASRGNMYGSLAAPGQWITLEERIPSYFPRPSSPLLAVVASVVLAAVPAAGICRRKNNLWPPFTLGDLSSGRAEYLDRNSPIADRCILVYAGPTRQPKPPRITRFRCFRGEIISTRILSISNFNS